MRMLWLSVLVLSGCGASPAAEPVTAVTEPVTVAEPVAEPVEEPVATRVGEESERCADEADCVLSPPACCSSSGPACAVARSRASDAAFRAQCDQTECVRIRQLVCPDAEGPLHAACIDGFCVLRR